jgi:hypothetical protein
MAGCVSRTKLESTIAKSDRHGRVGHVFRGRFIAILVDKEA